MAEHRLSYTESIKKMDGGLISITAEKKFDSEIEPQGDVFIELKRAVQLFLNSCKK